MDPIITPALFLLGVLALHSKTSGNPGGLGSVTTPPEQERETDPIDVEFPPPSRAVILDIKAASNGTGALVQHFKPSLRATARRALANESLAQIAIEGQRGFAYQIVPGAGDLSVAKMIAIAEEKNLLVLASLTLVLVNHPAPRLVLLVPAGDEAIAGYNSDFAILSEPRLARTVAGAIAAPLGAKENEATAEGSRPYDTRAGDDRTTAPSSSSSTPASSSSSSSTPSSSTPAIDPPVEVVPTPARPKRAPRPRKPRTVIEAHGETLPEPAPARALNGLSPHAPPSAEERKEPAHAPDA